VVDSHFSSAVDHSCARSKYDHRKEALLQILFGLNTCLFEKSQLEGFLDSHGFSVVSRSTAR